MSDQISWHVELRIQPNKSVQFRELTREMVESARDEPGTVTFERYTSDDKTMVHIYERYTSAAAAVHHLLRFKSKFGKRFEALVRRTRFAVYGSPSAELKQLLDAFQPTYLDLLDGFSSTARQHPPGER